MDALTRTGRSIYCRSGRIERQSHLKPSRCPAVARTTMGGLISSTGFFMLGERGGLGGAIAEQNARFGIAIAAEVDR